MTISQEQHRRRARRAFLIGLQRGRRLPADRKEIMAQVRKLLDQFPSNDQFAVYCKIAEDGGADQMVHYASVSLAAAVVLCRRMQGIDRALFVNQLFIEARTLLAAQCDSDTNEQRTLH